MAEVKINKGGRPKKIIDYEAVEKLASLQCTQEEIASFLDLSVKTLQRDEQYSLVFKKGFDNGKRSLRRIQWELAEKNVGMAIWLGKQYLGQREVVENINDKAQRVIIVNDLGNKDE